MSTEEKVVSVMPVVSFKHIFYFIYFKEISLQKILLKSVMSSHYKPSLEKCGITTIEIDIF